MQARHIFVDGMVQGVGYRAFVEREARTLGLVGWVRNISDGRVEVLAQGDDATLERLEALLHEGPGTAMVSMVKSRVAEPDPELDRFYIAATVGGRSRR